MISLITIDKKTYDRDYPDWVLKCPICNINNSDAVITINTHDGFRRTLVLCKECRTDLKNKLNIFDLSTQELSTTGIDTWSHKNPDPLSDIKVLMGIPMYPDNFKDKFIPENQTKIYFEPILLDKTPCLQHTGYYDDIRPYFCIKIRSSGPICKISGFYRKSWNWGTRFKEAFANW